MSEKQPKKSKKALIIFYVLLLVLVLGSVYALSSGNITGFVTASQDVLEEEVVEQQSNEADDLIEKIIFLRQSTNSNSLLDTAKTYNVLDKQLSQTTHSGLWRVVADCSYDVCEDKTYLNLINSIALSSDSKKHEVIAKTINTAYLWESRNEALFSESLAITDDEIRTNFEDKVVHWENYLNCNCPSQYDALFNLIQELNN